MNSVATTPCQTQSEAEIISSYFARIGKGWRAWSHDKRSMMTKQQAKANWEKRRARYGDSGQKQRSYKQWRAERNKPAIGDDGREIKQ